mmetsp:Transcript_13642/g.41227  ORF Transcript_13642/g.41227 Transcript_13642/m.41227 type:complete len:307 (+) Transcript_13642:142-1062(+)
MPTRQAELGAVPCRPRADILRRQSRRRPPQALRRALRRQRDHLPLPQAPRPVHQGQDPRREPPDGRRHARGGTARAGRAAGGGAAAERGGGGAGGGGRRVRDPGMRPRPLLPGRQRHGRRVADGGDVADAGGAAVQPVLVRLGDRKVFADNGSAFRRRLEVAARRHVHGRHPAVLRLRLQDAGLFGAGLAVHAARLHRRARSQARLRRVPAVPHDHEPKPHQDRRNRRPRLRHGQGTPRRHGPPRPPLPQVSPERAPVPRLQAPLRHAPPPAPQTRRPLRLPPRPPPPRLRLLVVCVVSSSRTMRW